MIAKYNNPKSTSYILRKIVTIKVNTNILSKIDNKKIYYATTYDLAKP